MMNKRFKGFTIIEMMIVIAIAALLMGAMPAMAGSQGDKIWTASGTSVVTMDGTGNDIIAAAFPFDGNSQVVVYYINATCTTALDSVQVLAQSTVTTYNTLTTAFCGGNTNYIHHSGGRDFDAGLAATGSSYFVIDDGGGNIGWGEFDADNDHDANATFEVLAAVSGFATGRVNTQYGCEDLSGVTFAIGSRIYPMQPIGEMVVGNATVTTDNNAGLFAATKGSPMLVIINETTLGASRLHAITVQYK